MPAITPCLWFDGKAEEAANFYCTIFPNSKITEITRFTEAGPGPKGSVMVVAFELDGQPHVALNGGPLFRFTEAISLQIHCDSQAEVDRYWAALLAGGGAESRCGWLKDKYGLSWQVVPKRLIELMSGSDAAVARRVTEAMMPMNKLDLALLEKAARG